MGKIRLADIFQNGMVLQREKPIYIWGNGRAGDKLYIQICKGQEVLVCESCVVYKEKDNMKSAVCTEHDDIEGTKEIISGNYY